MATIADVAREAGVSISTVSYALSGKRSIKPETRERVMAAAVRLRYLPDASARSLASRRSDIIAVNAPKHADTDRYAHMAFAMEVTIGAREHGYDTLLLVDDDEAEGMGRAIDSALADGMIVLDVARDDDRADRVRGADLPVVFLGLPAETNGLHCVDLDFESAVREALQSLADAGHREVALVTQFAATLGRGSNYPLRIIAEFERTSGDLGLESLVVVPDPENVGGVVQEILQRQPATTAVVLSTTNSVAQGISVGLAERGLAVPRDVSVIAVGMTESHDRAELPFDSYPLDPRITCPAAVDLLVRTMQGETVPAVSLVPPRSISRGTVAPAPRVTAPPGA